MADLKTGGKAPDFELPDYTGKKMRLSELRGRKILLYFFPKAETPGCTKQAQCVLDAFPELTEACVLAIGISPDSPEKLSRFSTHHGLNFALLSDSDHGVSEAYGVWGEKKLYGRLFKGITRSSFLIDEDGIIIGVWYKISPADTVPKAMEALGVKK